MIWLICNFLPFYAHVHTCSPSYTDEEYKTNVDSETVCLRLLIIGLIVPIRLCILSIDSNLKQQISQELVTNPKGERGRGSQLSRGECANAHQQTIALKAISSTKALKMDNFSVLNKKSQ